MKLDLLREEHIGPFPSNIGKRPGRFPPDGSPLSMVARARLARLRSRTGSPSLAGDGVFCRMQPLRRVFGPYGLELRVWGLEKGGN